LRYIYFVGFTHYAPIASSMLYDCNACCSNLFAVLLEKRRYYAPLIIPYWNISLNVSLQCSSFVIAKCVFLLWYSRRGLSWQNLLRNFVVKWLLSSVLLEYPRPPTVNQCLSLLFRPSVWFFCVTVVFKIMPVMPICV